MVKAMTDGKEVEHRVKKGRNGPQVNEEDDFILDQQTQVHPWHHSQSHQYLQEEK